MRRLQALAQNGLAYMESPFERERWEAVRAVAAEMAAGDDAELEELATAFTAQSGYACPKIDVRSVAFRDDRVLLVQGADDGGWSPPGGWADVGASPRTTAETELLEESGYRGVARRLVGVWEQDSRGRPRWPFYGWRVVFLCDLADDAPAAHQASEVSDVGFFALDALPALSGRIRAEQIAAAHAVQHDPSLPAVFE